jgi:NADP-dependent 3-hydroxy acid dehydrogenase YdfG
MAKVVVITGASAGVGRATAREFAQEGANIGLIARGKERLDETAAEVNQLGGQGYAVSLDAADFSQMDAAAGEIEEKLGPIDIWINGAMTTIFATFEQIQPEEFKRATEVTYLGTVWGTKAALKRMMPRDHGHIIQIGSALAYRSIPLQSAYCGAKHAIKGFTDSVRTELIHARSNVRLTMVQLPAVNTPQFDWCRTRMSQRPQPVPPIYNPEVPARAILWAAHHPRRELYVGGSTTATIIANKLVPGLLDKYLGHNGFKAQETGEPVQPGRPDNMFAPVPGRFAAHGSFDSRAHGRSLQHWIRTHPLMSAAGPLAMGMLAWWASRARRP